MILYRILCVFVLSSVEEEKNCFCGDNKSRLLVGAINDRLYAMLINLADKRENVSVQNYFPNITSKGGLISVPLRLFVVAVLLLLLFL